MKPENLTLLPLDELPVTDTPDTVEPDKTVIIHEIMEEFMKEFNVNLAMIERDTELSNSTLSDWLSGKVTPLAGDKLRVLAKYFRTSTDYLVYGVGPAHPYEIEERPEESA